MRGRGRWVLFVAVLSSLGSACGPRTSPSAGGDDDGAGDDDDDAPGDVCKVAEPDGLDGATACDERAPAGSFEPELQWSWTGTNEPDSIVTPLVANLTDDNGDGVIDLCDTPDIVVVASSGVGFPGHIYLLDGATGAEEARFDQTIDSSVTPAIGDLDGDGVPEIVTGDDQSKLIAFHHDGTIAWRGGWWGGQQYSGAVALADLDHDGDVEVIAGNAVLDHLGNPLWTAPIEAGDWSATAAADLDDDGLLEVVLGSAAYHHDGTPYYEAPIAAGYPQIADLDGDPEPEILLTNVHGLTLLEHDGTIVYQALRPTGDPDDGFTGWLRPATVHDFDGDGKAEFASSSANHYTVYRGDGSIVWSAVVSDQSGIAAGTAFDFLGDGGAEAMYADESELFVFGDGGETLLHMPRTSGTLSEYPVVADVDNDGSAEIVVTSNHFFGSASATVQVIRDREDRWIQARRIWNQHTYHVTNVREDGTIPQREAPHWLGLNTFRTNAQIGKGGVCDPVVE
jgi:hypothetical protein